MVHLFSLLIIIYLISGRSSVEAGGVSIHQQQNSRSRSSRPIPVNRRISAVAAKTPIPTKREVVITAIVIMAVVLAALLVDYLVPG
jgi:hypothetical protein